MKRFSDFAKEDVVLDGDKVKVESILNEEIYIIGHRIQRSRFAKNESGEYLTLQFEQNEQRFICFTGSDVLIGQLRRYGNEIPFAATIRKINRYYTLT